MIVSKAADAIGDDSEGQSQYDDKKRPNPYENKKAKNFQFLKQF
jgi:hypothetical protein